MSNHYTTWVHLIGTLTSYSDSESVITDNFPHHTSLTVDNIVHSVTWFPAKGVNCIPVKQDIGKYYVESILHRN